jgi:hypothetical protein
MKPALLHSSQTPTRTQQKNRITSQSLQWTQIQKFWVKYWHRIQQCMKKIIYHWSQGFRDGSTYSNH